MNLIMISAIAMLLTVQGSAIAAVSLSSDQKPEMYATQPDSPQFITLTKTYYLTRDLHRGNDVQDACADGYHFASVWELLDISHMSYDTELGNTREDSGYGPPVEEPGWMRTGHFPSSEANCVAWTSSKVGDRGLAASLHLDDSTPYVEPVWRRAYYDCPDMAYVWCVSDPVEE